MSALVEKMALIGQASWHGLEEVMPADASLEEWKRVAGLVHVVNKTPVIYMDEDDQPHKSEERFVLYRNDTKRLLSVVGPNYKVVQPAQVLDFFASVIKENNFTLETAGSLAGGKRVWALARTNNSFTIGSSDVVKEYLLLATSYDGTLATIGKQTSVRVVCNNTLQMCADNTEPVVRVTHANTFDESKMKIDLGLMTDAWGKFKEAAGLMHRITLTPTQAARWYAELLAERELTDEEVVTASADNRVLRELMQVYQGGKGSEPTLWGVINGVTAMADHTRGRSADTRLNSAWFGQGATLKARAWEKAMQRVELVQV